MILSPHVRLNAFTARSPPGQTHISVDSETPRECQPIIDVFSCPVAPYKANGPDGGMIADSIDSGNSPMDNINNTVRKTSTLTEFGNDHSCARVPFRGLQDDGVPRDSGHRDRPKWDHSGIDGQGGEQRTEGWYVRWKVERCNPIGTFNYELLPC